MKRILLVEDDSHVCSIVKKGLEEEGFIVDIANDGAAGLALALSNSFDLIILDIMLPKVSGLEACKRIREKSNIPILLLTALGTAENVADGLNTGADDYLVKPFKFIELIARINSLLRRSQQNINEDDRSEVYRFSDVILNNTSKIVTVNNQEVALTSTEFKLLLLLMKMPNKVYSRQEILEQVWEVNFDLGTNVVDVYINYLRKKLDKHGSPKIIHTVVGMGYVMREK